MSRLSELIAKVRAQDAALGEQLDAEVKSLAARRPFGLNFERHRPESVELPGRPVRKGDKVRILPPRGTTAKGEQHLWTVKALDTSGSAKAALLERATPQKPEHRRALLEDLVVVAEEKDFIYPGLISTGKVDRGGNKPFHTVINGENLHALTALTCTHRGKIDVIYIDPPYNTGARDWKYNNDYVEADDLYRHSKWLAFMERRLLIASALLNPDTSVLCVTIDEKEYLRVGLLLEQLFPAARIQMISTVIAPQGQQRPGQFSRVDEYIYFVMIGECRVVHGTDPMIETSNIARQTISKPSWDSLIRRGTDATRASRPGMFYPIFVADGKFHSVGTPLDPATPLSDAEVPHGIQPVWPIRTDGSEGRWQVGPERLIELFALGHAKLGKPRENRSPAIMYRKSGAIARVQQGEHFETSISARTMWNRPSHNAGSYGSTLLRSIIPERKFPFPKSLYAVEDCLRFFISHKKNAIVLDFFSGSGTTAHAVMRLNKQYGGKRQCISITNNEVAADEQVALRKEGLRPGDPAWEQWGICDYITKPRIKAAITGKTPEGEPIKGDYKFTDEFPMADGFAENAEFFTLTYETPVAVGHNRAFERIAPLLWMRAGSQGRRIDRLPKAGFEVAETYGLLTDVDKVRAFIKAVREVKTVRTVFLVTDDERRFQSIAQRLPEKVEPVRLYESYLTNFRFAMGR
jgi:adenine-specific DNA-methyltransferase